MVEKVVDYIVRKNPGKTVNCLLKNVPKPLECLFPQYTKFAARLPAALWYYFVPLNYVGTVLRVRKRTSVIAPSLSLFP